MSPVSIESTLLLFLDIVLPCFETYFFLYSTSLFSNTQRNKSEVTPTLPVFPLSKFTSPLIYFFFTCVALTVSVCLPLFAESCNSAYPYGNGEFLQFNNFYNNNNDILNLMVITLIYKDFPINPHCNTFPKILQLMEIRIPIISVIS